MSISEKNSNPTYKELSSEYRRWFSLGYIPKMENRLALISLLGWLVYELRKKKPDVTYYQIVHKLAQNKGLSDLDEKRIAVVVEDMCYGCKDDDFIKFGLDLKEVPAKIKEILDTMLPF